MSLEHQAKEDLINRLTGAREVVLAIGGNLEGLSLDQAAEYAAYIDERCEQLATRFLGFSSARLEETAAVLGEIHQKGVQPQPEVIQELKSQYQMALMLEANPSSEENPNVNTLKLPAPKTEIVIKPVGEQTDDTRVVQVVDAKLLAQTISKEISQERRGSKPNQVMNVTPAGRLRFYTSKGIRVAFACALCGLSLNAAKVGIEISNTNHQTIKNNPEYVLHTDRAKAYYAVGYHIEQAFIKIPGNPTASQLEYLRYYHDQNLGQYPNLHAKPLIDIAKAKQELAKAKGKLDIDPITEAELDTIITEIPDFPTDPSKLKDDLDRLRKFIEKTDRLWKQEERSAISQVNWSSEILSYFTFFGGSLGTIASVYYGLRELFKRRSALKLRQPVFEIARHPKPLPVI